MKESEITILKVEPGKIPEMGENREHRLGSQLPSGRAEYDRLRRF